ncbi:UDP-glucose 4-epimerase GalE [Legionella impletisoli]|uniref:UDP-glucose 4-epimerase n=1 Tax=Legionella impletisoli TaxID=343510 RepID=A0A917JRG7_9GAMM|nr:UDP-glucose 4-epimerase GalE [Legionella impletisoli]GGI78047.1 UDP-glucose 4-epimerase [Legionella impletisoli]
MHILVTGGLGYIGSHFVVEALNKGFKITAIDNLINSSIDIITAIETLTATSFEFYKIDLRNKNELHALFKNRSFDLVVHFAGLKSVYESRLSPLDYYETNLVGSFNLLQAMQGVNLKKIVFSSSATVYGQPITSPYTESHPTVPINTYGDTKQSVEVLLKNICHSDDDFSAIALRYFNPIGAHPDGLIGDTQRGVPNNLMPYINEVALKKRDYLPIFGDDYSTHDGTGVRDYIHVLDLVEGHISAINYLINHTGFDVFNLGTGKGYSVLDVVQTFEQVNCCTIPTKIKSRRPGDLAAYWADTSKAQLKLNWHATRSLEQMVHDSWNWQKNRSSFSA